MWERKIVVSFDDHGISAMYPASRKLPGGKTYTIAWHDVQCVAVETNSSGPWGADFWYLLEGHDCLCAYPLGATGEQEANAEFPNRFPGFNFEPLVMAVSWTSNARFVCWRRESAQ